MEKEQINEIANKILIKVEPNIESLTNRFSYRYRDSIAQETRIKVWEFVSKKYNEDESISFESVLAQLIARLHIIVIFASKTMIRQISKFDKRFADITNASLLVSDDYSRIDFEVDFKHYRSFLSERDFEILRYLFSVDDSFKNFDNISRQLGYYGKGASKYRLLKIAEKILDFNSRN